MSVRDINQALDHCLANQNSAAGLVHSLFALGCSDALIKAVVVGALGESTRKRVGPLLNMVRAYEDLGPEEQIDMLYSIVEKQDKLAKADTLEKRLSA